MVADQNQIYRVMYVSRALRPLTAGELDDLLAGAQLRNSHHVGDRATVYRALVMFCEEHCRA